MRLIEEEVSFEYLTRRGDHLTLKYKTQISSARTTYILGLNLVST